MTVHLYTRSSYTLLRSTIKINDLVLRAKELGFRHCALTDRNVLFGAAEFIRACRREGIHPIVGMEVSCLYHDEEVPFLLLAKNNGGYCDLMRLSGKLAADDAPCTPEDLMECGRRCFLIVWGEGGWADGELVRGDFEAVREKLLTMKNELPTFDVALSYMDSSLWRERNPGLKRVCASLGIRTAALNKIYYLREEDAEPYRVLCAIRKQTTLSDSALPLIRGRYYLSDEQMRRLYDSDDLARTEEIASECRADFILEKTSLPVFETQKGVSPEEYLPALCAAGLRKRMPQGADEVYVRRLKYELEVIQKMHFEDYFLIVYDFIRYARKQGINIGPGRGSAAGSLVAYCLGITQVDPVKYGLLFERFLNPERVSMPDIDTDIPDDRRDEVIRYVVGKYGMDHAAGIITFGTFGARQSIRDVGKAMNLPQRDIAMLARLVPSAAKITLESACAQNPRMKQVIASDLRFMKLYDTAVKLEGLPRHTSQHAAGIVLSRKPLEEIVPTMKISDDMLITQYPMEYMEERGLIKMDFLALRNLSIIDEIVKGIRQEDPSFDLRTMPMDDQKVYEIFSNADTTGIFQFESAGMQNLLRKMRPECFDDVVAALALFRPASAESIPSYLANKQNRSRIVYPAEQLAPVLKETYGVMVYQEQAMMTSRICAGFSLGRADVLRKAMSKKNESEMNALRGEFIAGCEKNGFSRQKAEELFELVSRFSGYGFNKSHAVAYGMISCQMAYLKAHYPLRFYTALLNSVTGDEVKTAQYISECRRRHITVVYPDVSRSEKKYTFADGAVLPPLSVIKGIGSHTGEVIAEEREKNGPYEDLYEFTARMSLLKIGRGDIEQMIRAGALDCFRMGRKTMLQAMDDAESYAELVRVRKNNVLMIDTGLVSRPVPVRIKDDALEISQMEREALGFNIGEQPITSIRARNGISLPPIASLLQMRGKVSGFALVADLRQHKTKHGDTMAFLKLNDETGEMDIAVMPRLYSSVWQTLRKGTYILFDAKISDEGSALADRITVISAK